MLWRHTPSQPSTHGIRGILTPDHEQVVTYCDQDRLELRSARDGSLVRSLGGRKVPGNWHLAVHPDGKSAFTCDYSGTIESVSLLNGNRLFQLDSKPGDRMTHLTVAKDSATGGGLLIVAYRAPYGRQLIAVCNANTGAKIEAPRGGLEDIAAICVHPLSAELMVAGLETRVWSLTSPPLIAQTNSSPISGMSFWGSDDLLFCGGRTAGDATWGLTGLRDATATPFWAPSTPGHHRSQVSGDGRISVVNKIDTEAATVAGAPIWVLRKSSTTSKPSVEIAGTIKPGFEPHRLSLSLTGRYLAISDTPFGSNVTLGKALAIYDTNTGKPQPALDLTNIHVVRDIGWLHGDQHLVGLVNVGNQRGRPGAADAVILWNAASGKIARTATIEFPMDILSIAPDRLHFAVACTTLLGNDRLVRIWDGDTLTVSQELRLHFDAISAIAWHPTKPILAACSISNSIRLYDLSSAKIIEQWRSIETPQRLLFSPTGKYLISESNDAAVGRIWQVE
jgi:WD40 repeat protein